MRIVRKRRNSLQAAWLLPSKSSNVSVSKVSAFPCSLNKIFFVKTWPKCSFFFLFARYARASTVTTRDLSKVLADFNLNPEDSKLGGYWEGRRGDGYDDQRMSAEILLTRRTRRGLSSVPSWVLVGLKVGSEQAPGPSAWCYKRSPDGGGYGKIQLINPIQLLQLTTNTV